jgi:RNA methyltransferase, trmH family, group 2
MINIVLLEPEIAQNTGNIGRSCVATNSALHLIRPLGFKISSKEIKRSGLDYWEKLNIKIYSDLEDFYEQNPNARNKMYMATTKARKTHSEVEYKDGDYIMFGKESTGIPEEILVKNQEFCVRIPMWGDIRSLNLSNSVAIILYEALRQLGYEDMELKGNLHRLKW